MRTSVQMDNVPSAKALSTASIVLNIINGGKTATLTLMCLPFHKIQSWNGQFLNLTSLFIEGYLLYAGHDGSRCLFNKYNSKAWEEVSDNENSDEEFVGGIGP